MAKTDMERIGLFSEMGYVTIKDPYSSSYIKPFNATAGKGKQMLISGLKSKTAFQDGYFDPKFSRMMEGEAYSDTIKQRRQLRLKEAKKNLGGPYVPPGYPKKSSGTGNYYGTLSGPIASFSAATRPRSKYKAPGINFLINPGKKGTGYGYLDVTIGHFPKYETEPYDRARKLQQKEKSELKKEEKGGPFKLNLHPKDWFDENPFHSTKSGPLYREDSSKRENLKPFRPSQPPKLIGGCKAGTFEPYPKHSEDPYIILKTTRRADPKKMKGGAFKPPQDIKSTPTISVMQRNVTGKMNSSNFLTVSAAML